MKLQDRKKGKIRTVGQIQENLPPELPLFAKLLYFGQFGIGQARMAVHRRLCYPHVTSAAVVYGGRGYWTNGQRTCLTRSRKTFRLLQRGMRL